MILSSSACFYIIHNRNLLWVRRLRDAVSLCAVCVCSSDALRTGPGEDLFGFLADCVQDFLRGEGMEQQELSLGKRRMPRDLRRLLG